MQGFNTCNIFGIFIVNNRTSLPLKVVSVMLALYVFLFFSAKAYAQEVSSVYGLSITKFENKPPADEYITLDGTTVVVLNTPEAAKVRLETIKHSELNLFLSMDRARPAQVGSASQVRTLGRNQEDGFTVSWVRSMDASRLLSVFGNNVKFYSGFYYILADTNGDKKANRIYKVSLQDKEGRTSYIAGYAEKEDGTEITSAETTRKARF